VLCGTESEFSYANEAVCFSGDAAVLVCPSWVVSVNTRVGTARVIDVSAPIMRTVTVLFEMVIEVEDLGGKGAVQTYMVRISGC
jgi:hypothetical protein